MVDLRGRPIEILLVEDDPADRRLTMEELKHAKIMNNIHPVDDGEKAMAFLRREPPYEKAPRPDLVLLDLNLPLMDGREVLAAMKADDGLKTIPVVILTTSRAESDIREVYSLAANCYVTKPVDLDEFSRVVRAIEQFWFTVVVLPNDVR